MVSRIRRDIVYIIWKFVRPGTVQDFQNLLVWSPGLVRSFWNFFRPRPVRGLKFMIVGKTDSISVHWHQSNSCEKDSTFFGRKLSICCGTVKIWKIPSRSNFSSDPDLDFDNIEIKWDLYGTRTRRLAVRHFATHAFCFRSTLPEKNLRSITSYHDRKSNIYLWLDKVRQDEINIKYKIRYLISICWIDINFMTPDPWVIGKKVIYNSR